MTDLKERITEQPASMGQVVPAVQRWRNLYITRSGKTVWGFRVRPTRAACRKASKRYFAEVDAYIRDGGDPADEVPTWNGGAMPMSDILFAVPMPWRADLP